MNACEVIGLKKVYLLKNRYVDSVTLMTVAVELTERENIDGAECGMGTKQNVALLRDLGYEIPADTTSNDVMIALDAQSEVPMREACVFVEQSLSTGRSKREKVYHSVDDIVEGEFDVVQISLPGEYAIAEAYKAIDKGCHVFMFTADVSLEQEHDLKVYARDHGCLMMGPDAGVGLLGGVAMAAGSIVKYGPVGVIGASGSGSQEVACLIEQMGLGVTCILGTGGRDLKKTVGGVSMMADMDRLDRDEDTKLICLVSMLADREVMEKVLDKADTLSKPVVAVFLGADEALYEGHKVYGTFNLTDAAKACVRMITGKEPELGLTSTQRDEIAQHSVDRLSAERKYFRGLYTGGTFSEETLMAFRTEAPDLTIYTNRDNTEYARRLQTHKFSEENTLLDMGDLDFTAEAPHTVFDPAQRVARFQQELNDPEVALISMDIILGPGVAPNPASCYLPLIHEHPDVVYVFAVCGGEGDPQGKNQIKQQLRDAGVIVAESNQESALLSIAILKKLKEREK